MFERAQTMYRTVTLPMSDVMKIMTVRMVAPICMLVVKGNTHAGPWAGGPVVLPAITGIR